MFDYLKNKAHGLVQAIGSYQAPPAEPQFALNGTLIPDQFVEAADNLCKACPAWKWQKASKGKEHRYLKNPEKQFLLFENVICKKRVRDIMGKSEISAAAIEGEDDILVLRSEGKEEEREAEEFAVEEGIRFYKLYITYDPYYHTPRMWFTGTTDGRPLSNEEIYEDVMEEYKDKTLTVESFPHLEGLSMPTVHPCKHSVVLKSMSDALQSGDKKVEVGAHSALFIFLKFISSVIPTVEYDIVGELHFS